MADLQQKCATPPATRTTKQIEKPRRADTTTEYEERCRAKTQLAEFELNGVEIVTVDPGKASPKVLGKGAYGAVIELKFRGRLNIAHWRIPQCLGIVCLLLRVWLAGLYIGCLYAQIKVYWFNLSAQCLLSSCRLKVCWKKAT